MSLEIQLSLLENEFPQQSIQTARGVVTYRQVYPKSHIATPTASTIVLLHGVSSNSASWLACALKLRDAGYSVIAWDAPGYGGSDALADTQPLAIDYAHTLSVFLQALQLPQFYLVGHSLGALMASAYLSIAPDQMLAGLVYLSPARGYGNAHRGEGAQVMARRIESLRRLGFLGLAEARAAALLSPQADSDKVEWVRWNMSQLQEQGFCSAVFMLSEDKMDVYLVEKSNLPIAVMVGDVDDITAPVRCRELAELLGVPLGLIEGAGHACYIDAPDSVAARLTHWIKTTQVEPTYHRGSE